MEAARHLSPVASAFDPDTGEVFAEGCPGCQLRDDQIEGLKSRTASLAGQITKLEREGAEIRGVEMDAGAITEVLEFYNDFSGRRVHTGSDTDRWKHARMRMRHGFTAEQLKRAIVGAPHHEWIGKKQGRMDPKVLFSKPEWVEECEALAGKSTRSKPRVVSDLSPIEAAAHCLAREFGLDAISWEPDASPERKSLQEVWGPCPLHPFPPQMPLRIRERTERGSLELTCVHQCDPEAIYDALRGLYGLQAARRPTEEIAELRVLLVERERLLRVYGDPGAWAKGLFERDRGAMARQALRVDDLTAGAA